MKRDTSTPPYYLKSWPLLGLALFLWGFNSLALTTIQTSTSVGYYRDYAQQSHFPVYHSWSLHGFHEQGLESSLNFLLDNDFAVNKWTFFPTQAEVDIPWGPHLSGGSQNISKIRLGRQSFLEGFDYAILDGIQAPYSWSLTGGIMPLAGTLRSNDVEQETSSTSMIVGLVAWESFFDYQVRVGYTARDEDLETRYTFLGVLHQWSSLPFKPQAFLKEEWNAETMTFNQLSTDFSLALTDNLMSSLKYQNLAPRPIDKKNILNFIYRLFSISPTETLRSDNSWEYSDNLRFSLGVARVFYDSSQGREIADRQDFSFDFSLHPGHWWTPVFTHLSTYGGNIYDQGLRYSMDISDRSKFMLEYDVAWLSKVNGIEGWVQHARSGYETQIAKRAKLLFNFEVERNQYFEFDGRAMTYVTNYL